MRAFAVAFVLVAFALPAAAGPIDTLQYRSTLRLDRPPGPGPHTWLNETAYPLGGPPLFGVIASSEPAWLPTYLPFPSADYTIVPVGGFTSYIAGHELPAPDAGVMGGARYFLDLELRDSAGHTGVVSFAGDLNASWTDGGGTVSLDVLPSPEFVWLGDTRYLVQPTYNYGMVQFHNISGDYWIPVWYPPPPSPSVQNGDYLTQENGRWHATIIEAPEPVGTPEPGTLALTTVGLSGLFAVRRLRRAA
jgi:hypothetical protein